MFMEKLISVIIPFYKVENEIIKCLDSVLKQTYNNIEVICVGRKDDFKCINIVENYVNKHDKFKCIYQDKRGLGNARNCGKKIAKGDYILFLDGDDYIENNAIELLVKSALVEDSDIVCTGFDRVDKLTGKVYSREMISMEYNTLNLNDTSITDVAFINPSTWGKLFKKEIIADVDFINEPDEIEDLTFFLENIIDVKKISFVKKILWHYLVREESILSNVKAEKIYKLNDRLINLRKKYLQLSESYLKMYDIVVYINLAISMSSRICANDKKNAKDFIKYIKESLDNNFVYWDKSKIRFNGKITIKTVILSFARISIKCNFLIILIYIYNFMIKRLKIDIKW